MIRIINRSERSINITKDIILKPKSSIDVNMNVTKSLYQLQSMGIIDIIKLK